MTTRDYVTYITILQALLCLHILKTYYEFVHIYTPQHHVYTLKQQFENTQGVIRREDLNRRKANNTVARRKTMIYKTLHRKLKIWATRTSLKTGNELECSRSTNISCSTSCTRRVTIKRREYHVICESFWKPVFRFLVRF